MFFLLVVFSQIVCYLAELFLQIVLFLGADPPNRMLFGETVPLNSSTPKKNIVKENLLDVKFISTC